MAQGQGGIIGASNIPVNSVAGSPAVNSFTSGGTYTASPGTKFVEYLIVGGGGGAARIGGGGAGG